ncbi:hypothetical protein LSCM1_04384 [Leishmania martiniquensis]|uniref:C2H2-type domain-containing protein n=1 Tax=Leishmania martiniquensis TaxID=1580590 RepID=A0A836GK30_9TRYP|nr:hypothetical protein LSCM1_04384 [Leishmania martiniquensis]
MRAVNRPIFFVIGSTGSGKSKVAVHLAHELRRAYHYKDVVVINCDVYQCYTDLPILTNKPSAADLGGVTHVSLGFLNNDGSVNWDNYSSAEQQAFCHEAEVHLSGNSNFNVHSYERIVTSFIADFFQRHEDGAVIVCGGTCYYAQALIFADSLVNESEPSTLSYLDSDEKGGLWERLNAVDAEAALRYHPNDCRRIKRLLEIYDATGQAPSSIFNARLPKLRFDSHALFIVWVRMERKALDTLLNRRVDLMLQRGMLDEVRAFWLSSSGNLPHSGLSEAIGCKELSQYFSNCSSPLITSSDFERAITQIKSNTRRYARQQERWIQNRLLPLLHSSPLKESPTHFVQLWTEEGVDTLLCVQRTLDALLMASPVQPLATSLFPLKQQPALRMPVSQEKCEVCNALIYGRGQMEVHLKSKRHRYSVRRLALEKEHRERYGRELPSPKRKRNN